MLKNLSDNNSRTTPVSTSTSDNPNSLAAVLDCPHAKTTVFPSGEILLSLIRFGASFVTRRLSLLPSTASAIQREQYSPGECGHRTKEIFLPSGPTLNHPSVPRTIL